MTCVRLKVGKTKYGNQQKMAARDLYNLFVEDILGWLQLLPQGRENEDYCSTNPKKLPVKQRCRTMCECTKNVCRIKNHGGDFSLDSQAPIL